MPNDLDRQLYLAVSSGRRFESIVPFDFHRLEV